MSAVIAMLYIRNRINISNSSGFKHGPFYKQSFKLGPLYEKMNVKLSKDVAEAKEKTEVDPNYIYKIRGTPKNGLRLAKFARR